jgi:hypothetical protein
MLFNSSPSSGQYNFHHSLYSEHWFTQSTDSSPSSLCTRTILSTLILLFYPEDRGGRLTTCDYQPDCTASHSRRQPSSWSLPWKSQISQLKDFWYQYITLILLGSWTNCLAFWPEHNSLKDGSVSVFRWKGGETYTQLGLWETAISITGPVVSFPNHCVLLTMLDDGES